MEVKADILFLSSGEQFDHGLIKAFQTIGLSVAFVAPSNVEKCKIQVNKAFSYEAMPQYIINIPSNYSGKTFISLLRLLSLRLNPKFVILPRLNITLFLFLTLAKMQKKDVKKYILWYSPSPAFIFKAPYFIRNCNNFSDSILIILKAILSALFTPILPLFYEFVLLRDALTYRFLNKFYRRRKVLLLPSVWYDNALTNEGNFLKGCEAIKIRKPYVLTTISLGGGKFASLIELYYFKLVILLAKFLPELNFIVVGSSMVDVRQIDNTLNFPENLHVIGRVYGTSYRQLLLNATAVLAFILLPGNSNRVMESIAYGKPTIVSKIAQVCHPGLKHLYNCFILELNPESFVKLRDVINNNIILDLLGKRASALNSIYMRLCCKRIKQLFS